MTSGLHYGSVNKEMLRSTHFHNQGKWFGLTYQQKASYNALVYFTVPDLLHLDLLFASILC